MQSIDISVGLKKFFSKKATNPPPPHPPAFQITSKKVNEDQETVILGNIIIERRLQFKRSTRVSVKIARLKYPPPLPRFVSSKAVRLNRPPPPPSPSLADHFEKSERTNDCLKMLERCDAARCAATNDCLTMLVRCDAAQRAERSPTAAASARH